MFDQRLASAARATARIRLEALVKHLKNKSVPFFPHDTNQHCHMIVQHSYLNSYQNN
jgi:hypothetical protein